MAQEHVNKHPVTLVEAPVEATEVGSQRQTATSDAAEVLPLRDMAAESSRPQKAG
jgi:hypothetical protein